MPEIFENLPQQDISLEEVQELPMLFERVTNSQELPGTIESQHTLNAIQEELEAVEIAFNEYQQQLAEKVINTGEVSSMDQSRGVVLSARKVELTKQQESIERILALRAAIGHLAVAKNMLDSLDDIPAPVPEPVTEFKPLINIPSKDFSEFVGPLNLHDKTVLVEVNVPQQIIVEQAPVEKTVRFTPRLGGPLRPPRELSRVLKLANNKQQAH